MAFDLGIVLALLAAAIVMFALNRPRMDAVALIMLAALPLSGVIEVGEALAGFSDPNIVLIAALFVIGDGLVRTGVARLLGDWLTARAGNSESRLIALLMAVVCGLGSLMSSTAVTAIFIPVALRIAQGTGTLASRLMMPLSMAALISGMMTLIATAPNLVVSSELERNGFTGFHFFAFTPFGIPIIGLAIIYMLLARRWLGRPREAVAGGPHRSRLVDWIEEYGLAGREHRVEVTANSALAGRTVADLGSGYQVARGRDSLGQDPREQDPLDLRGARLVAIQRARRMLEPGPHTEIRAGDILLVDLAAPADEVQRLKQELGLRDLPLSGAYFSDLSQEIGMAELIVPPTSALDGKTLAETGFHDHFGLRVIGLRRGHAAVEDDLSHRQLRVGDSLLVIGPWPAIRRLQGEPREAVVFNVPLEMDELLPAPGKALPAVACLAVVVVLMVSGLVPNVLAALIGCLLMGALGVIDLESAYRSIDWKTLILIVGMLPFSIALQRTGGVDLVADGLLAVLGNAGGHVILACLFALTAVLGMFISNTATAVLMAPIALAVAKDVGASPYPFAMIVALAASTAFMTPVSSPVNTLVVTPGDYTFGDFVRVGVPFAVVVLLVSVVLVPWLLPLYPAAVPITGP